MLGEGIMSGYLHVYMRGQHVKPDLMSQFAPLKLICIFCGLHHVRILRFNVEPEARLGIHSGSSHQADTILVSGLLQSPFYSYG